MSIEYIPYTYLLGWSEHNVYYYGVQYANNKQTIANPTNLWVSYYTSSLHVKDFISRNGDPDIIQIRKTFTNKTDAQAWEVKVLRRLDVRNKSKWLNVNPGGHGFICPSGKNHPCYGKPKSLESKQKQSATRKLKAELGLITYNHHTPNQLDKIRQTGKNNKGKKRSPDWKKQRSIQYKSNNFGSKVHKLENMNGSIIEVYNLKLWCVDNGIDYGALYRNKYKNKYSQNWKLIQTTKE